MEGGDPLWCGQGLDAAVAEPTIVVSEIASGFDGLEMLCVGEIEVAFVGACGLELVDVSAEEGEGDGAGDVDAGVFELAVDEEGDGDEAASGGFGEVAGPLVDADCADDLLRLRDLVHLGPGGAGEDQCGKGDAMESVSHRAVIEIRRYLVGKVLSGDEDVRYHAGYGFRDAARGKGSFGRVWAG